MDVKTITSSDFDNEVVNAKGTVLVEFFGTWCMPCKMLSGILDKTAAEFGDKVQIVKLDIDQNTELAKAQNVMTVPTMIVFKNGEECERSVGFRQMKQIVDMVTPYI